jgi:hypothetical protein
VKRASAAAQAAQRSGFGGGAAERRYGALDGPLVLAKWKMGRLLGFARAGEVQGCVAGSDAITGHARLAAFLLERIHLGEWR